MAKILKNPRLKSNNNKFHQNWKDLLYFTFSENVSILNKIY